MSLLFDIAALISVLIIATAAIRCIAAGLAQIAAAIDTDPQAAASALVVAIAAGILAAWFSRRYDQL
jgi:hypothetical protein